MTPMERNTEPGQSIGQGAEHSGSTGFNEEEWLKLLFLVSDTEQWVDDLWFRIFHCLPVADKKKLLRRTYYLTAPVLAHILERHYYRIPRHPGTAKFTIPVPGILHWLREASAEPVEPLPGTLNYKRIFKAPSSIGFDQQGQPTCFITILTDAGGQIVTAFPGMI
jgi:hypothetical protein